MCSIKYEKLFKKIDYNNRIISVVPSKNYSNYFHLGNVNSNFIPLPIFKRKLALIDCQTDRKTTSLIKAICMCSKKV